MILAGRVWSGLAMLAATWPAMTDERIGNLLPVLSEGAPGECTHFDGQHNVTSMHLPAALLYKSSVDEKGRPVWSVLWQQQDFDRAACVRSVSLTNVDTQTVLCLEMGVVALPAADQ